MSTSAFRPQPAVALHHQVKEDLLLKLRAAQWRPGSEIPAEPALCKHYGVSRGTLRRAIGDLVNEGWLERYRGKGTFVSQPKLESGFAGSFGRFTVVGPSLDAVSRRLACRRERAQESVARMLGVRPGAPLWRLERLRFTGGKPATLQTSYIPRELCPDLDRKDLEHRYLLHVMAEDYALALSRAVEHVDPTLADGYAAKLLGVRVGAPLFRLERTTYAGERIVELRVSVLRGDIFRYRNEFR